jgi:protocatechuate 3,4-dioxygenase beta subunit
MHSDDEPVGRVLDRRQALAVLGLTGATLAMVGGAGVARAATDTAGNRPSGVDCVAKPEMVEGPYFVDEGLNRSDIRIDTSDGSIVDGARLTLNLAVQQITNCVCSPLPAAMVDIWHCDAHGVYSDEADNNSLGRTFLRGYQITDRAGRVRFVTILPGWYVGRTVHLHIKIRTTGTDGNPYEFTSQLYVPTAFSTGYLATDPYASHGNPDTTNETDMFYGDVGDQMLLVPHRQGRGWAADFRIGLDLSDTEVGDDDGGGFPGGPPGGPPSGGPSASASASA